MKKISYVLGLVAMVVMMAMTSCSKDSVKVSEDVQKMCDGLDECAELFDKCETQDDVFVAAQEAQGILNKVDREGLDLETELTDDDKEALKESFVNYTSAMAYKIIEVGLGENSRSEAEEQMKKVERKVEEVLEDCNTLGEFSQKIERVQW